MVGKGPVFYLLNSKTVVAPKRMQILIFKIILPLE